MDSTVPPVVRWDSLYAQRRYVELQKAVRQWPGPKVPVVQLFAGIAAQAMNDPDDAILSLKPLVDRLPPTLTALQLRIATSVLGESYRAIYQYRESADLYHRALRRRQLAPDSTTRARWRRQAMLAEALRDVLPQRVQWAAESRRDTLPNDGVRYGVRVGINGQLVPKPLSVNLHAGVTTLDSAVATRVGVQLTGDSVAVLTDAGKLTTARVGVIASLTVGQATVSNVVVLVMPTLQGFAKADQHVSAMSVPPVAGIIGLPVLNALGRITFTRDGHVALSSPGISIQQRDHALADTGQVVRVAFATVTHDVSTQGLLPVADGTSLATPQPLRDDPFDLVPLSLQEDTSAGVGARGDARSVQSVTLDLSAMTLLLHHQQLLPALPTLSYPGDVPAPVHSAPASLPEDLAFVALLFALFVVPKALQRYRIPSAITSLVMGAIASQAGLFQHDPTLHLLSTFGIVALFLFAGLEIDGRALRRDASVLSLYVVVWSGLVALTAGVAIVCFGMGVRAALLIGLALMTPSTGFILSSLPGFGLQTFEQQAVKTCAVGSELLALGVLFFVLQSTSAKQFSLAVAAMIGVVIIIPLAFRFFAAVVAPHAPRSEFAFLLMVAVVCAYATRRLGVYYLVGAFLVGVAAQRFRGNHPAMSSERMVDALESFGSVFIPFYFFRAGTEIVSDQFTLAALGIGLLLLVGCIPVRVGLIVLQRRFMLGESFRVARRIGSALTPTLVFTLVLVEILRDQFALPATVAGAVVLYTIFNTSIPAFMLHGTAPEFEHVEASPVGTASSA